MSSNPSHSNTVDTRGPRFGAAITSALLLIAIFLTVTGAVVAATTLAIIIVVLFAWGAIAGVQNHPWGLIFRSLVRPRLSKQAEFEDATPPRFAQLIGLIVVGVGLLLHAFAVPYALLIALIAAFIAAGLNASIGFCLGCEIYLLLARIGVIKTRAAH